MTAEKMGIIGRYTENGFPVILKFVNALPEKETMNKFPFLAAISWQYDGKNNNGMPDSITNEKMIILEDAIEAVSEPSEIFSHAYSRTGNNLKELVYYGTNQKDFMDLLNKTLVNHPKYPIEINFYNDPEWTEFKQLLHDFKEK